MSLIRRVRRFARQLEWMRGRSAASGAPESFEEQIYAALVQPGDICVDVGANRGDVSLQLARLAGPEGKVFALEPVPPTYDALCENIQADAGAKATIVTMPFGASDAQRDARITVPRGVFAKGSMAPEAEWRKTQQTDDVATYDCRFVALDDLLSRVSARIPDLIKMDVEGAELFALRGATGVLSASNHPVLFMELYAPWEAAFGYKPWAVLELLLSMRYTVLFMCPEGLVRHVPTESQPFPPEYVNGYNVIACDETTHAARLRRLAPLLAGGSVRPLHMGPAPRPNA